MSSECMLTTDDNPYDPFEQFKEWFMFDLEKGYNTSSRLGRLVKFEDRMSQEEQNKEVERVIDEIILHDFLNMYKKVRRQ